MRVTGHRSNSSPDARMTGQASWGSATNISARKPTVPSDAPSLMLSNTLRANSGVTSLRRMGRDLLDTRYSPPPPLRKHRLVQAQQPCLTVVFLAFSDRSFCGQRCKLRSCASIIEENPGGWIMLVVVPPAHTNILLATAPQYWLS